MNPWRSKFPYFAAGAAAFLDSAASAQKPAEVLHAMDLFARESYANTHRGVHGLAQAATQAYEDARSAVARFIGAPQVSSVVFTGGTTAGINTVAHSLWQAGRLSSGGAVVATALEHHSNYLPWQRLAHLAGVPFITGGVGPQGEFTLSALQEIFARQKVALLAVTHVSNVTGEVLPIADIVQLAHRHGALVMVDGAQAVAHLPVDVKALGADFYVFSAHKLYGPTGLGVLYMAEPWSQQLPAAMVGGGMVHRVGETYLQTSWAPPPHRWEAGTPPIVEAVGLHAALRMMEEIGWPAITAHEAGLTKYLIEKLGQIPGLRWVGQPQLAARVGVASFQLGDIHPHDVGSILADQGVAVRVGHHCAQPLMKALGLNACVRASLGLYNDESDIDRLDQALRLTLQKLA